MWFLKNPKIENCPPQKASPPKAITIQGNLFPENVQGYIRFNYNKVLGENPWTRTKSLWTKNLKTGLLEIKWNAGTIEDISGERDMSYFSHAKKIHKHWIKKDYFPCFWREGIFLIDEDSPIGKDIKQDMWPTPTYQSEKKNFYLWYCGKLKIHEFYRPVPDSLKFIHEFKIIPTDETVMKEYYPSVNVLSTIRKEEGEWISY